MSERPTVEVTLSDGSKIVLHQYLTIGESRQIRRTALQAMHMSVGTDGKDPELKDLSGEFISDMQDLTLKLLIKEAFDGSGARVENSWEFVQNLNTADGNLVYDKADELSGGSALSKEGKKKS